MRAVCGTIRCLLDATMASAEHVRTAAKTTMNTIRRRCVVSAIPAPSMSRLTYLLIHSDVTQNLRSLPRVVSIGDFDTLDLELAAVVVVQYHSGVGPCGTGCAALISAVL